jgi:hypothetical protein
MAKPIDISAEDHGSIFLLRAMSRRGRDWIEQHVSEDRQEWGGAIVVEHRYVFDIAHGAIADGLRVVRFGYTPSATSIDHSDITGADDAVVPREIESNDPNRWAEYNRKFNALFTRRA